MVGKDIYWLCVFPKIIEQRSSLILSHFFAFIVNFDTEAERGCDVQQSPQLDSEPCTT